MKKRSLVSLVLGGALALSLCACGSGGGSAQETPAETVQSTAGTASETPAAETGDGKIVITDQLGKTIEFDEPPQRLATTIMPFPYIFHAVMGDNDYMVGCNPSSMVAYKDSALRYMYTKMAEADTSWVDTSFVVNIEELLKLQPDVVFQWNYMTEEIEKMEAAGIKVIALQYGSVEDLETWIRIIAALYQKEERGEEIITYFHQCVDEVTQTLADGGITAEDYPTVVHLSDDMTVAGQGFTNYWMEQSGAVNPAADLTGEALNVDMEQMMLWNPDLIYIGNFTEIQPSDLLENRLEGEDWSLIKAVQEGQVYKIPIGGYRWDPPGVETPLMIKWAASHQYPELFADMDMKAEVSEFYQEVYNFTLTDEMLAEILDDTQN